MLRLIKNWLILCRFEHNHINFFIFFFFAQTSEKRLLHCRAEFQSEPYRSAPDTISFRLKTVESVGTHSQACSDAVVKVKSRVALEKNFVIRTAKGVLRARAISV